MKAGWQSKKLRDVCELINGRAYNKPELLDEGKYRVLRVGNFFTNNHWYYSDLELEDKNTVIMVIYFMRGLHLLDRVFGQVKK